MIIERSVAARNAFQAIVKIENDFVQRQFVGQHDARWRQVLEAFLRAALVLTKLQNAADRFVVRDDHCLDDRLFDFADVAGIRKFRGTIDFDYFAGHARDAVAHARRRRDQVEPEFALQPLLLNFNLPSASRRGSYSSARTGNNPAKTIGLMASKPGSAGAARSASVMVSPMRASATSLMFATTKPTSPASSSWSATGFGVSVPSVSTS